MAGFSVKRPTGQRRSYSVYKKTYIDGAGKYERVEDERIESINANLRAEILTPSQAELQVKELIKRMKSEQGITPHQGMVRANINQQNMKAFEKYWSAEYEDRKLVRPYLAENEFYFALRHLNDLSLYTVDRKELQRHVDKVFDNTQHKRYVNRINALLTFLDRGFQLHVKKTPIHDVSFVMLDELKQILNHVEKPELKALYLTLFGTGARLGEAFMFDKRSKKPDRTVFINKQLDDKLDVREIKNRKPHPSIILKECEKAFDAWAATPNKEELRKCCQHPLILAARKAFPNDESKHISPHDLRHSYAIEMLSRGIALDRVARLIGDSISSAEKHYAGFAMKNLELDAVRKLVDAAV